MADTLTILPVRVGIAAQTFQVTLDGRPFRFEFDWLGRIGRWSFSLFTGSNVPLVRCKGLPVGADVLRQIRYNPAAPQGVLLVTDTLGLDQEPDLSNFGDRVKLIYFGAE